MTEQQQNDFVSVISTGCPVETALEVTCISPEEFDALIERDPQFVVRAKRSASLSEVHQLQNVKQAGNETKNWRASVWWLEHCRGDRYSARPPGTITQEQFDAFRNDLATIIDCEVRHSDDRTRVIEQLTKLSEQQSPTEQHTDNQLRIISDY